MENRKCKEYLIDFLSVTVHLPVSECVNLYHHHFGHALFDLVDLGHGAKGFKHVLSAALGFQLKHTPGFNRDYCSFVFPGKACKAIPPEFFSYFYKSLVREEIKFNVSRIDIAYDNVPFTPSDFFQVFEDDKNRYENGEKQIIRTLSQRENVQFIREPFMEKDDGSSLSRDTCYFGSRQSERFLRVYNKRGPTRLEIEYKGKRAALVASKLFIDNVDNWLETSISHLLDFIDIDIQWWKEFIGDQERAYAKLHCAKEISLERKREWLLNQVSPTLAAVTEITRGQILSDMLDEGGKRMHKNNANLLSQYGK